MPRMILHWDEYNLEDVLDSTEERRDAVFANEPISAIMDYRQQGADVVEFVGILDHRDRGYIVLKVTDETGNSRYIFIGGIDQIPDTS